MPFCRVWESDKTVFNKMWSSVCSAVRAGRRKDTSEEIGDSGIKTTQIYESNPKNRKSPKHEKLLFVPPQQTNKIDNGNCCSPIARRSIPQTLGLYDAS